MPLVLNTTSRGGYLDHPRFLGKKAAAELLLADILGISKEKMFAYPDRSLNQKEIQSFEAFWFRFEQGEPMAYLLKRKEFFNLNFYVDSRVLIPRPETELLVEKALNLAKNYLHPRFLDIGTGCGAIALAIQSVLRKAKIWGSDISEDALEVAHLNAKNLHLTQVDFVKSNLLGQIPLEQWQPHFFIANLPYIGTKKFNFVEKNVQRYEPELALFGGEDGLDLYRILFGQVRKSSWIPHFLIGEFGFQQRVALAKIISANFPLVVVNFYQDLAGLDRFFV
ncbi:MAG: protein-(glutamine-N5) methyltransferase, release factor glutamine methyltransferase, partial [Candidatus Peregrinibacteria bacterium GW2011_GWE2_39_6]